LPPEGRIGATPVQEQAGEGDDLLPRQIECGDWGGKESENRWTENSAKGYSCQCDLSLSLSSQPQPTSA